MRLRRLLLLCILLFTSTASAASGDTLLKQALEEMLALDQKHRGDNLTGKWSDVAAEQAAIDASNLARLLVLLRDHDWPRVSDVGEDAALGAFLVLQHADLAMQERYLPVIQARVKEGEAKPAWLALLTDRILVRKGEPQIYGTQFRAHPVTGLTEPHELVEPERVNERRASLGLKPLKRFEK